MNQPPVKQLIMLPALFLLAAASPEEDRTAPYRILQQANRIQDPELAASAYASDGALIFEHAGQPPKVFRGQNDIRKAYVRTFGQVDDDTPIQLEFRFEPPGLMSDRQSGAYRLTASVRGRSIVVHGRFAVKLKKENGSWRFAEDRGAVASAAEFERLRTVK